MVIEIHNDDIAVTVDGQGGGPFHLSVTRAEASERPLERAVRVEHIDPVVLVSGDIELTVVEIDVPRSLELSKRLAFFAELAPIIPFQIEDLDFVTVDVDDVDFVFEDFESGGVDELPGLAATSSPHFDQLVIVVELFGHERDGAERPQQHKYRDERNQQVGDCFFHNPRPRFASPRIPPTTKNPPNRTNGVTTPHFPNQS